MVKVPASRVSVNVTAPLPPDSSAGSKPSRSRIGTRLEFMLPFVRLPTWKPSCTSSVLSFFDD